MKRKSAAIMFCEPDTPEEKYERKKATTTKTKQKILYITCY